MKGMFLLFGQESGIYCFAEFNFNRLATYNYRYSLLSIFHLSYILLIGCFFYRLKYGLRALLKNGGKSVCLPGQILEF
ncbi:hypothetical protein CW304_20995 [Bacillus sp. UFRGS-B20]|nr:hypothetical protein CW304_20995 [Bacillus sp. UFRGS-B20]